MLSTVTQSRKQYIKLFISAIFIGSFTFLWIYGANVINVSNDAWLLNGNDLNQHYLGWKFYRESPWHIPVGLIDGITLSPISVIYTDSIPILAVFFKLFSHVLPITFQYFGIWGLLCFILQAIFSNLIFYRYSNKIGISAFGCVMLTINPIVLQRMFVHSALAANWLILASFTIWVYRDKVVGYSKNILLWTLLLCLSVGIHIYYVPMVFAIMCAYFLYIILEKRSLYVIKVTVYTIFISICCALLFMWILGGFYGSASIIQPGLGNFSSNFNTFINSQGHSLFLKPMPLVTLDQGEGYGYLGFGIILLLLLGITQYVNIGNYNFNKSFCIASTTLILILLFYAISPQITVNGKVLLSISLPKSLYNLFSVFRATGRFIWPICYIISIISILLVMFKYRKKVSYLLLAFGLLIQIIDISPSISYAQQTYSKKSAFSSALQHSAWEEIGENFKKVKFITDFSEPQNYDLILTNYFTMPEIFDIANWAINNHLSLNDFYIGRRDTFFIENDKYQTWLSLMNGKIDKETVYIFPKIPCALIDIEGIDIYVIDNFVIAISSDYICKKNKIEPLNWSTPLNLLSFISFENGKYIDGYYELMETGILYGPYFPLQPGDYQIAIEGKNLDSASFDCISAELNSSIPINILSQSSENILYNLQLSASVMDIEFRVIPTGSQKIIIEKFELANRKSQE